MKDKGSLTPEEYEEIFSVSNDYILNAERNYNPPTVVRSEKELKAMKAADDRRYRKKHKVSMVKKKAAYYRKNKSRINREFLEKLKSNIQSRIAHNLRCRLGHSVKNGHKAGSAVKDLGCTIIDFKIYVEEKFLPGMTWDNYGKWHLDHVIPLCKFNLTDSIEFKQAAHYTNYQPLWAIDNLTKNKY